VSLTVATRRSWEVSSELHADPGLGVLGNQGAGIATADLDGSGQPDLLVLRVDAPAGTNRGLYRVGRNLDAAGTPTGGWSGWLEVPEWESWENQGAGIAVADLNGSGRPDLLVLRVDAPDGPTAGSTGLAGIWTSMARRPVGGPGGCRSTGSPGRTRAPGSQ
jgi:hypothetical protein